MRIAICDDNTADLMSMQELFRRVEPDSAVDLFSDGRELLSAVFGGAVYAIMFLDIIMPGITGMDVAREVRKAAPDTPVVFLTDSDAFAVEAFSVNALHYIIKPITESALEECLRRLEGQRGQRRQVHVISSSGIQQMLFADEIHYAQSEGHYCNLFLKDGSVIKVRMTQSEVQNMLGDLFLPVSRGLTVNAEFIRELGPRSCTLKNGQEILLSRKNQDEIHAAYAAYVFSRLSRQSSSFFGPDGR